MTTRAQAPCRRRAARRLLALAGVGAALAGTASAAGRPRATSRAIIYAGTTSQRAGRYGTQELPGHVVAFTLSGGMVRGFSIPWVATCLQPQIGGFAEPVLARSTLLSPIAVHRGHFEVGGTFSFRPAPHQLAHVTLDVSGTIRGSQARGTLRATVNDEACDTGHVRWTARATTVAPALAYPREARPRPAALPPVALLLFTRDHHAQDASTIDSVGRGGPPPYVQLFTRPRGGSDSHPTASPPSAASTQVVAFERAVDGRSEIVSDVGALETMGNGSGDFLGSIWMSGRVHVTRFGQGAHDPAVSPNGTTIAFSRGSGANCSLWVMKADGTAQRPLTDNGTAAVCDDAPAWSPDGSRVAFRRTLPGGSVSALVVAASGGAPEPLPLPAGVSQFNWAPGRELVYLAQGSGDQAPSLHAVRADGTGDRVIVRATGLMGRPAWSPTGDAVAIGLLRSNGTENIATVSARGGALTPLIPTAGDSESDPVWVVPAIQTAVSPVASVPSLSVRTRPRRRRRR